MAGFMTKIREKQNRKLAQCLMASAMSANMLLTSLGGTAYAASEITKADAANAGTVTQTGDVFNVYADSATAAAAVNHFSKFNLDSGNIANLYFGTRKDAATAINLINFVDQRININGTVNAIKGNAIGGNLYFVSVDGMVVGSTGVINAGAINVMTPTRTAYSDLSGQITAAGTNNDAMLTALQDNSYAVNPEGTITVAGQLNAVDGIKLQTANISLEEKAVLRTESGLDFGSLVNIKNADGTMVDSGITGGTLQATQGANGDIVLSAVAAGTAVAPSEETGAAANFAARTRTAAITTAGADAEKSLTGSSISARGNVDISATATNVNASRSITRAAIELNGAITGQKITVAANASDTYDSSTDTSPAGNWAGSVDGNAPWISSYHQVKGLHDVLNVTPAYSYMDSAASVTVGKSAALTSTLAMAANHQLADDKKNPAMALTAVSSAANTVPAANSSAAVAYAGTSSSAAVDVQGTLTAHGVIDMSAQSADTMNVKAAADGADPTAAGTAAKVNAAIAVATGENTATVNVGKTAKVNSAASGVYAAAAAVNTIDVASQVNANTAAVGATAVSVLDYTSDAAVTLDGQVSGPLAVAGTATNTTTKSNLTANNALTPAAGSASQTAIGAAALDTYVKSLGTTYTGITDKLRTAGNLLRAGAAIGIGSEKNTAAVNVGSTASLNASAGSIDLGASTDLADTHMTALSGLTAGQNTNGAVSAALLYARLDNTANVGIADGEAADGQHAVLQAGQGIAVSSTSTQENSQTAGINDLAKNLQPESFATFAAESAGDSSAGNTPALAGAANINILNNTANVAVGNQAVLDAREKGLSLKTNVGQNSVVLNGKPNADTAAVHAAGGAAGVAEHSTIGTITVGSGARLTGSDWTEHDDKGTTEISDDTDTPRYGVELTADNQNITTDLSYSAGKAGKQGFEGLFSWLGGNAANTITVAKDAALTAKRGGVNWGKIDVAANMNNILTNLAGAAAWGTGGASMGASVAVTDETITNTISLGGTLNAHSLDVNALTDGSINTVSIAGSLATENSNANTTKAGDQLAAQSDSAKVSAAETRGNKASTAAQQAAAAEVKSANTATENTAQIGTNPAGTADEDKVTANSAGIAAAEKHNQAGPSLNLAAAGSASVNLVTQTTRANLNQAEVTLHENIGAEGEAVARPVNVKAEDGSFVGAWSGAAAMAWQPSAAAKVTTAAKDSKLDTRTDINTATDEKSKQSDAGAAEQQTTADVTEEMLTKRNAAKAALAGTAAVNAITKDVHAAFTDVTIVKATAVKNIAQSDGAAVAAALAPGLTDAAKDSGTSLGAASVNASNNTIEALLKNVTMTDSDGSNVYNLAYDSDTQIAGGVNAALALGGKMGMGAGGTLAVNDIQNDLSATISGGKLTAGNAGLSVALGNVVNHAANEITQVTTALGVSAAGGAKSGVSFDGVMAYGEITNNAKADITDGAVIAAGTVDNAAYDASDLNKSFDQAIADNGVDSTGATYTDNANHNAATQQKTQGSESNDDWAKDPANPANMAEGTKTSYTIDADKKGSSKLITTALSLAADVTSNGVGSAGAAAVSVLNGSAEALVEQGSQLTAGRLNNTASTDGLLVNVAGGASAAAGFLSGAGSVSIQTTNKTTKAAIDDSTMTAGVITVDATSNDLDVNLAGQISAGKNAAGLALAVNHLKNTTGAYIYGSTLDAKVESAGNDITVNAANKGQVYSIGAGVSGGSTSAVNGSMALNQGTDDVEAIVDEKTYTDTKKTSKRTTMSNVNTLKVTASDSNMKVAVAGGVQAAGTAAVGGAIAYNEIGSWKVDKDNTSYNDRKQQLNAELSHADITTAGTDAKIDVTGTDTSTLGTAAAGVGSAGTAAVEGAADTSLIGRQTHAAMTDTNIDKEAGGKNSALTVSATNSGKSYNTALVIAVSGTASVGAAVAVDNDSSDADALISGGTLNVGNLSLAALSQNDIMTIGAGGAASTATGIAGSVGVNVLTGNTTAKVDNGAKITADKHVMIAAQSDDAVNDLVGLVKAGEAGVSAGVSVGVNTIAGSTEALVDGKDTQITAGGNGDAAKLSDKQADTELLDRFLAKSNSINPVTYMQRSDSDYKGIAVSASSTHNLQSQVLNNAAGTIANSGNLNVNTLAGTVMASVTGAALDAGSADIHIAARDYANSRAFVGAVDGDAAIGATGLGSDTLTIGRATSAALSNTGTKAITARNLAVTADSQYGAGAINAGGSLAADGGTVGNVSQASLLQGTTAATINGAQAITLSGNLDVTANRKTVLHTLGVTAAGTGLGAGGLNIDIVQDQSTTSAGLTNSQVGFAADGASAVQVSAANDTEDTYRLYSSLTGEGSVKGNISSDRMKARVTTEVSNAAIGSADAGKKAKSIDIGAVNTVSVTQDNVDLAANGKALSAGVNVLSIDDTVQTDLDTARLYSTGAIKVSAQDTRTDTQHLGNTTAGSGAGSVNAAVMNVGKSLTDTYAASNGADSGADLSGVFSSNGILGEDLRTNTLTSAQAYGKASAGPAVAVSRGGEGAVVNTSIKNSTLQAGGALTADSQAVTNAAIGTIVNSGSLGSLNHNVGVVNSSGNSGVTVDDSQLTGASVALNAQVSGTSRLDIGMGSISAGTGHGGAFGYVQSANRDSLVLNRSTLKATAGNITAAAADDSTAAVDAFVMNGAGGGAASVQIAEADAAGQVTVSLGSGNSLTAVHETATVKDGAITVSAVNKPTLTATGEARNLTDSITVGQQFVSVNAGTKATPMLTKLSAASGNTFNAAAVGLKANAAAVQTANLAALTPGAASSGYASAAVSDYSTVTNDLKDNVYVTDQLTITGNNTNTQTIAVTAGQIGGTAAQVQNKADSATVLRTTVNAAGEKGASALKNAAVTAGSSSAVTASDTSAGAAVLSHQLTTDTQTNISGNWTLTGDWKAAAANQETLDLKADTSQAALVNGSGAELHSKVAENAALNVKDAAIHTTGSQTYEAGTNFTDTAAVLASGFGGLAANGSSLLDQTQGYTAAINLTDSVLEAEGAIKAAATAVGTMQGWNDLTAGSGGQDGTAARSSQAVTYQDNVNVQGSTLRSQQANQRLADGIYAVGGSGGDISLAAYDSTKLDFRTIAYHKGGIAGSVHSEATDSLTRNNAIHLSGAGTRSAILDSAGNTNLYAGRNAWGGLEGTALEVLSDSYDPSRSPVNSQAVLKSTSAQSNTVTTAAGTQIASVGDVNIAADSGADQRTQSSHSYGKSIGVTTVAEGTIQSQESSQNQAVLQGTITAGTHSAADVTIDGQTGGGIKVTVNKGGDWLSAGSFTVDRSGQAPVIVLPDLNAAGGNINIHAAALSGSAALRANGNPQITVRNNSALTLRVKDATIANEGGTIYYNGNSFQTAKPAAFTGSCTMTEPSAAEHSITIQNTAAAADINIVGTVANRAGGDVIIDNAQGSISIGNQAVIDGRQVTLQAQHGTVTQTNPTDTVNVSGTGIHADGDIYISGNKVNLDGLVQSGYASYSVTLTDDAGTKITAITNTWQADGSNTLTDSMVMGNPNYLVNTAGAVYDETAQCYKYNVAVYYNPQTKQLLADDVRADGGHIYIAGKVDNTGTAGRLLAADGAAAISLDTTNRAEDVVLHDITNAKRTGSIRIMDDQTGKVYEYQNGKSWTYTIGQERAQDVTASTQFTGASNPITIAFLSAGADAGIKVDAQGNIIARGSITSADAADIVSLNSTAGSISGGGIIHTDNLTAAAAKGIDLQHAALDDQAPARIDLKTTAGSIALHSAKGDLAIKQAAAATAGSSVTIRAQGNLLNGNGSEAAVTADRITLSSAAGTIGTDSQAFVINAGTKAISGNPEDASLSAAAQGDIYLTQQSGDMRVNQIRSDGNVTLTAMAGNIVDASPINLTAAALADRLATWQKAGITPDWSEDQLRYAVSDSVLNSTAGTVVLRDTANVSGGSITLNASQGGIGVNGNHGIPAAYKAGELENLDTQKALSQARDGALSAVYDTNGNLASITMDQRQPLTIKLADANGKLAIHDKEHTYIATTKNGTLNLSENVGNEGKDAMLLAGAGITQKDADVIIKGRDLTLASGTGSIGTADQAVQTAITGSLSANSGESMYISQTGLAPLTVNTATAGKDINLKALKGIMMTGVDSNKAMGYLTAGNVINLSTENGNIGDTGSGIRILNNGAVVNAAAQNGAANVYLTGEKTGDLVLGKITATELSVTDDTGTVKLARAANTTQTASQANIKVENATIAAQDINLTDGRMTATDKADGLTFKAARTITQANTENSVLGSAGAVTFQTGTAADEATGKAAVAGGSIDAASQNNTFAKVNLRAADNTAGINGSAKVVSNAVKGLTANFGAGNDMLNVQGGDVQVENVADGAALTLGGKLTTKDTGMHFTSSGKLTVAAGTVLTSGKALVLSGKNGVTTDSGAAITADTANLTAKSGDITLAGPWVTKSSLTATAGQGITLGTVDAGAVNLTAAGRIELNGGTTKVQSLTANAGGDITTTEQGNVTSSGMMSLTAGSNISLHDITVKAGDTTLTAKQGSIGLNGTTSVQKLTANAGQDISTGTSDVTSNGIANLTAGRDVKLDAVTRAKSLSVKAGHDITSTKGILTNTDNLTAGNDIKLSGGTTRTDNLTAGAGNNITLEKVMVSNNLISAAKGDISLSNNTVFANNNIVLDAGKNLTAGTTTTMMATNFIARAGADLTVTGAGDTVSARGDLSLQAGGQLVIPTTAKAGTQGDGGSLTLAAGKELQLKEASAENGNVSIAMKGNEDLTIQNLSAAGTADVRHSGSGGIKLDKVEAGNLNVTHDGSGSTNIDTAVIRNSSSLKQEQGDIHMKDFQGGNQTSVISQQGNIDIGTFSGRGTVTIFNYGREAHTKIDQLTGADILMLMAFHKEFGVMQVNSTVDILLGGDNARRAIGWKGAHEAFRGMQPYLFRQNLPNLGDMIALQSISSVLPVNASKDKIEIEAES